uniref:Uncharacterized protein n=1 Tax=Panagrolaimus sp. ES5 TaxID=591445 RepID=A0AC34GH64_9BILA
MISVEASTHDQGAPIYSLISTSNNGLPTFGTGEQQQQYSFITDNNPEAAALLQQHLQQQTEHEHVQHILQQHDQHQQQIIQSQHSIDESQVSSHSVIQSHEQQQSPILSISDHSNDDGGNLEVSLNSSEQN